MTNDDKYELKIEDGEPVWYPTDGAFQTCTICSGAFPLSEFERMRSKAWLRNMGYDRHALIPYTQGACKTCAPPNATTSTAPPVGLKTCTKCGLDHPAVRFKRFYTLNEARARGYSGERRVFYERTPLVCKTCDPQKPYIARAATKRVVEELARSGAIPQGLAMETLARKAKQEDRRPPNAYRAKIDILRKLLRPLIASAAALVGNHKAREVEPERARLASEAYKHLRSLARELKHAHTEVTLPSGVEPGDVENMAGLSPAVLGAIKRGVDPQAIIAMFLRTHVKQDTWLVPEIKLMLKGMQEAQDALEETGDLRIKRHWLLRALEYAVYSDGPADIQAALDSVSGGLHVAAPAMLASSQKSYHSAKAAKERKDGHFDEARYHEAVVAVYEEVQRHLRRLGEKAARALKESGADPLSWLFLNQTLGGKENTELLRELRHRVHVAGGRYNTLPDSGRRRGGPSPLCYRLCLREQEILYQQDREATRKPRAKKGAEE